MTSPTSLQKAISPQHAQDQSELDEFVYIVTHDLKEPLRGIVTYINFMFEDHPELLEGELKDRLQKIDGLSRRMSHMLDGLTTYSRIGRLDHFPTPIDVNQLVQAIIEGIKHSSAYTDAEIIIASPLPTIKGRLPHLETIFKQLIDNGLKFNDNPMHQRQVKIDFSTRDEGDITTCVFVVEDNGIGIPLRFHDRIFKLFKGKLHRDQYGDGIGHGLALVKKIVELNGGSVWVESTPGKGSRFYFTITDTDRAI